MKISPDHARNLGELIRTHRRRKNISQETLGEALGRSRHWITQLEKGTSYDTGKPFAINPHELVRIALQLDIPVPDILIAANVPKHEWPDLGHIRSKDDSVRTVDLTALSTHQINLIESLITELKLGNRNVRPPTPDA